MIIPQKHQDLNKTIINIGAEILECVKKKERFIDDIFDKIVKKNPYLENLVIDDFLLSIIFLLMLDLVELKGGLIKRKNGLS